VEPAGQRDRTATRSGGNRRRISLRRVDSVILYHNRRALAGDNSPARQTFAHLPRSTADRRSHSGGRAGGPGSRGGDASLPVRVTVVGGPDGPRWRSAAVVKAPLTATTVRLTEATPTVVDWLCTWPRPQRHGDARSAWPAWRWRGVTSLDRSAGDGGGGAVVVDVVASP